MAVFFPGFNDSLRIANIGHQIRNFAAGQQSIEERVISAVNKYVEMRREELKNQDDAEDKTKALEALGREVTLDTKWDDLGFDDLDKVEVLLEVEDEFNALQDQYNAATAKAEITRQLADDAANEVEAITKTKDALAFLKTVKAMEDVEHVKDSRNIRRGKGKMRNRRYVMRRGPLIVFDNNNGVAVSRAPVAEVSGTEATVVLTKSASRFCVQASEFASLWILAQELCLRLQECFAQEDGGEEPFQISFQDSLPLHDYFALMDDHFALRKHLDEFRTDLTDRTQQYRVVQKRLLVRFKDRNPTPLNHLDALLSLTFEQTVQLTEAIDDVDMTAGAADVDDATARIVADDAKDMSKADLAGAARAATSGSGNWKQQIGRAHV